MEHSPSERPAEQPQPGMRISATTVILLAGDVISFLVFAALGRSSHGEAAGLGAFFEVAKTAAPFLLGWLLVAPWFGAYRVHPGRAEGSSGGVRLPSSLIGRTALAWLVASPVGLGLRALFLQRGIPLSFALVTFITNLLLLLVWRSIFAWLAARRQGSQSR